MKVLKFGGTSVGSAERMKELAELINKSESKIVVLSAMSGTTNALVQIAESLYSKKNSKANQLITQLEK
jgi:aspartate kinase